MQQRSISKAPINVGCNLPRTQSHICPKLRREAPGPDRSDQDHRHTQKHAYGKGRKRDTAQTPQDRPLNHTLRQNLSGTSGQQAGALSQKFFPQRCVLEQSATDAS
jgi:hypothetical protein